MLLNDIFPDAAEWRITIQIPVYFRLLYLAQERHELFFCFIKRTNINKFADVYLFNIPNESTLILICFSGDQIQYKSGIAVMIEIKNNTQPLCRTDNYLFFRQ